MPGEDGRDPTMDAPAEGRGGLPRPVSGDSDSALTVLVALAVNVLTAAAKSVAATITASASMTAKAAHSWADAGNELFLVVANRRSARPPDPAHPLGYGREAYVWSLSAALGRSWPGARCRSPTA